MNFKSLGKQLARLDWTMVLAVGVLLAIGVLFIYSAGFQREDLPINSFHKKQLVWVVVGVIMFLSTALIDYRNYISSAVWIYAISIVLLVAVFIVGTKVNGSYRWLRIGGFNLQPSEFAKIATLIALAAYVAHPARSVRNARHLLGAVALVGLPFLLIVKEPDLGTSMVLVPITMVILFAAGLSWRLLFLLIIIGIFVVLPLGVMTLDDYQQERIMVFFHPDRDPQGAGWNKMQSEIAVGSGGFSGKGYLKGTQNVLGFLPRTVAPTDFIFSVIGEEMGFMGSSLLLFLYATLFMSIARAAIRARDRQGRFLALGVLGMLFTHVFINIAMTVGLMPITGLPLPLISYGGSFMLSTMIALGLTQSVYIRRRERT